MVFPFPTAQMILKSISCSQSIFYIWKCHIQAILDTCTCMSDRQLKLSSPTLTQCPPPQSIIEPSQLDLKTSQINLRRSTSSSTP